MAAGPVARDARESPEVADSLRSMRRLLSRLDRALAREDPESCRHLIEMLIAESDMLCRAYISALLRMDAERMLRGTDESPQPNKVAGLDDCLGRADPARSP